MMTNEEIKKAMKFLSKIYPLVLKDDQLSLSDTIRDTWEVLSDKLPHSDYEWIVEQSKTVESLQW